MRAQHLEQHFAPAGGVRGQQHAPGIRVEEILERRERPLGAQVHAPFLRRGGGEVVTRLRLVFDLEALESTRVKASRRACSSSGARYSSSGASTGRSTSCRRSSYRSAMLCAARSTARGHVRAGAHHRVRAVDSRAACRWCRRTAAGRTRCPAARGRRSRRDRSRSSSGRPRSACGSAAGMP